jgi:ABC-type phosphate/phosphonate transport system substrate-binding protein
MHPTAPSIPHPFAARATVPEEAVLKVRDALVALSSTAGTYELFGAVGMGKLVPAKDSDYDVLRQPR